MIDVELSLWHMERDWRDKEGSLSTTDDPLALILDSCDNVRTKPDPNSMILTKGVETGSKRQLFDPNRDRKRLVSLWKTNRRTRVSPSHYWNVYCLTTIS